jgi:hypothetical protein
MKYSLLRDTSIRLEGKTNACQPIHQQLKCKFWGKRMVGDGNIYVFITHHSSPVTDIHTKKKKTRTLWNHNIYSQDYHKKKPFLCNTICFMEMQEKEWALWYGTLFWCKHKIRKTESSTVTILYAVIHKLFDATCFGFFYKDIIRLSTYSKKAGSIEYKHDIIIHSWDRNSVLSFNPTI